MPGILVLKSHQASLSFKLCIPNNGNHWQPNSQRFRCNTEGTSESRVGYIIYGSTKVASMSVHHRHSSPVTVTALYKQDVDPNPSSMQHFMCFIRGTPTHPPRVHARGGCRDEIDDYLSYSQHLLRIPSTTSVLAQARVRVNVSTACTRYFSMTV